ncbi:MAG: alanine--tRNA ligase [Candidatus Cloacimonadota bacterium]|nr:alanine--tRNA ligase [Candidatus Cloacimonadota bacterium]
MYSKEIRQQFIDFFKQKGHKEVKSAPVIPIDDPTLLFTNAGMNQFKDIFLGKRQIEYKRAVDSQKCIRAGGKHNDLEEVGHDGYHHTFFEMLGNWSFADYYKKEAIIWAWELLTKVWKLPKNKLYATVHHSDKEAYEIWEKETDIITSHIEYHGDKDNFWEMGDTGPCGPCSEIHFDKGISACHFQNNPKHHCKVNGNCHRYIELWNLVFIQYYRDEKGVLQHLKNKYVDTGAGFERLCQILQNKDSNYDIDLFTPILSKISELSGIKYIPSHQDRAAGISHRVIADHIRALSFALADGGMPSNEGRGYVLRRILRRAARHGRLLNFSEPFLYKLVDTVVQIMGDHFSELADKKEHIKLIIKAEEERFNLTLDKGLSKFEEIIDDTKGKTISGQNAFMLYDTYGFPLDLTKILAEEKNLEVDEKGFEKEMEKQKKRARSAAKFQHFKETTDWIELHQVAPTQFVGYEKNKTMVNLLKYSIDDDNNVELVFDRTPFYAESGGQVADIGHVYNQQADIKITDVQKEGDIYIHYGKLQDGEINSEPYTAAVLKDYRKNVARNHTATHLLHKTLKEILGEHVNQKGSLVHPEYLRFDFTHYHQVSIRELQMIEELVNNRVRQCLKIKTEIKNLEEAKKEGATALFGEKYGETVRVVSIDDYSKELCGGTHLNFTGEIGLFKIRNETSIAAGVRRIEAITGFQAEKYVRSLEDERSILQQILHAQANNIIKKAESLVTINKKLQTEIEKLKMKKAGSQLDDLIKKAQEIDGINLVVGKIKVPNQREMRQLGDQLKNKLGSGVGILASEINDKVALIAVVTKDITNRIQAGKIISQIAKIVDGKGGGRPDMAMAGGKNVDKINELIQNVPKIVRDML